MEHQHLPRTPSTMDAARAWAEEGAPHMALVTADEQTAGRGRQGKTWHTFPGRSFAGTFVVREGQGAHLPLLASLAVVNALEEMGVQGTSIKWPNDILLNGQKLAGILVESTPRYALVGIGLNFTPPPRLPVGFAGAFLSSAWGNSTSARFLPHLSACFSNLLTLYKTHGWLALNPQYTQKCATIGQKVTWNHPKGQTISGIVKGLTPDGALELTDETGASHLIQSGEIIAQSGM